MSRSCTCAAWLALCFPFIGAIQIEAASPVTVASADWKVLADPEHQSITIEHALWGTVLENGRLREGQGDISNKVADWTAEAVGTNRLTIRTSGPSTAWSFDLSPMQILISSTSPNGEVAGQSPAGRDRTLARLLDPEGVPVVWQGTGEVEGGYGGARTRHASFLPRQNPGCMYFALGPVAGRVFHSVFDAHRDAALEFSDETRLDRPENSPDLLQATIPVPGNALIRLRPDYYTQVLGVPYFVPFDDRQFPQAPTVWCSWTSYYGDVNERAVVANTDWLAEHLKPYGFQYVQVDDGYDRGLREGHYWIEHWDPKKFPHGPQWLTKYIRSKGLHPGLWLVPNAYAGAVSEHPDWYLRDNKGEIVRDYGTPALDSTNPEVLSFLRQLFTTLNGWGFEYYKFDGEHALPKYVPAIDHGRLYDSKVDPLVAYRGRLKVIRDVIGPETFVEGCPAGTPLNGIGYFNSYFNGQDVYNNWNGMYALFSSINANAFLNHVVVYVMPGEGMEIGPQLSVAEARRRRPAEVVETARSREDPMIGFGVSDAEARTLVSWVALSGVVYSLASVMPELPHERLELLQSTLPPMPIRPMDLFSRGTDVEWDTFKHVHPDDYIHNYPELLDLKVKAAAGAYDVVALPNWRGASTTKSVSFAAELGIDSASPHVVFDFWNRKLLGTFRDQMSIHIEPHDTRVLLIHPLLPHPQLLGTTRHITGALSVQKLAWNAGEQSLRGDSVTVPGKPYTLFVHLPSSAHLAQAGAVQPNGERVPVQTKQEGELLIVTWDPPGERVQWQLGFSSQAP